jgi:hypothetical protein
VLRHAAGSAAAATPLPIRAHIFALRFAALRCQLLFDCQRRRRCRRRHAAEAAHASQLPAESCCYAAKSWRFRLSRLFFAALPAACQRRRRLPLSLFPPPSWLIRLRDASAMPAPADTDGFHASQPARPAEHI